MKAERHQAMRLHLLMVIQSSDKKT